MCWAFRCEKVCEGCVVVMVRQIYELDGATIVLTYWMDQVTPQVVVTVHSEGKTDATMVWQFDDFDATHAFWRPHSTDDWRGAKADYHRQVYQIRKTDPSDDVFLQPFYNWQRNGAMFWSCWRDRRNVLVIGAVRPSKTRVTDGFRPLCIRNGQTLCVPVQEGQKEFVIGTVGKEKNSDPISDVEAFYRQAHGLDLNAYLKMDLNWDGIEKISFPRLFIGVEDRKRVQQNAREWAWFWKQFQDHVDDRLFFSNAQPDLKIREGERTIGYDPAGAYLASGDSRYAEAAFEVLDRQLHGWVCDLGALGPTVDALIGFAFAGPFRAAVMAFDLIADFLTDVDRTACLRKFAFLTEVFFSTDAWPDLTSGLSRGNMNFHASVVCARGLAAVLLDGHPKQRKWLEKTRDEATAFLRMYHFDSGVAREALTYQFNVLAQFTLLSVALRRAGLNDLFQTEPMLKRSFDMLAHMQTPGDLRTGMAMLPTVGHVTSYGWGQSLQACFAWAAKTTVETDADFSARMMAAWHRAGSPVISLHDFFHGQIWWLPLCLVDRALPVRADVRKSNLFDGFGAVFRSQETQGYLLVKMGRARGHYDPDEGSMVWYAWGVPILADFGCQYNPNIECAWLHNRLSFDRWNETGEHAFEVLGQHWGRVDGVCGKMVVNRLHRWADRPVRETPFDFRALPGPRDIDPVNWQREVFYVKDCEAVLIRDVVTGDVVTDWHLQVFADSVCVDGKTVHCRGQFGVDLDVYMASPDGVNFEVGSFEHLGFDEPRLPMWWWRGANWTAPEGVTYGPVGERALTLSLPGAVRGVYLALLIARPSDRQAACVEILPDGFSWQMNGMRWSAYCDKRRWVFDFSGETSWQETVEL